MSAEQNRRLVADAFVAWADGTGDVFDLLSADCAWTITGSSSVAGTYLGADALRAEVLADLYRRLQGPIEPTVRKIVADDDHVVVLWDGHATALDGKPYDNTYSWHLRLEQGEVVEVTAFFDTKRLDELLERVTPEA